ncbi:putative type IX sorting system protein PorV2 [Dinghuibacter silviterrae]|uniref:PorV/PorQ family protein n=1 Tax=Dinghuibacter silviterrae TaxID=1539049 RepID=A0A4R8DEM7_9BACT|nr:PorV/PorQ family protein [Dinghuibacter silviterrae]TDW95847.1 hypothetical protein EDB95_3662 [Dinghuibacter silviterrae]
MTYIQYSVNTITRLFLLSFASFCLALRGRAQFVTYSNDFLNIGAGAAGLAMGGAQVSSVKDATAGYYNPAGLMGVKDKPDFALMHAEYFAGIGKYDYASAAFPINDGKRVLGLSLLRFAVDDIPNTLYLVNPQDGSIDYNNIQTFSSADYAFLLSLAQKIRETENGRWSVGFNTKIIYRDVGSFAHAWGFGFDGGLQYLGKKGSFGVVVKDMTTTFNAWSFSFTDEEKQALYLTENDIPVKSTELTAPQLIVGGSYLFHLGSRVTLRPAIDLDVTFDGMRNTIISSNPVSVDPHVGLEAGYKDFIFLRAGVNNFQRALADGDTLDQKRVWIYQPSIGAGFKIKFVTIDYAFTNLANQSDPLYTNIFSLKFDLGPLPRK